MRPAPLGIAGLTVLAMVACSTPTLVDVDGRPLQQPLLLASIDNGWVAVDSGSASTRAVLELRTETPRSDSERLELAGLQLRFGDDYLPPSRLHCELPAACRMIATPVEDPDKSGDREVAEAGDAAARELCVHIVRAEFVLPRVPLPRDSLALIIGASSTPLIWRR